MGDLLKQINSPDDIHTLSYPQLNELAGEIRRLIIETVAKNGGHLAPSLGVVELTLGLYKTFHTPPDKILWDVGHQSYAHKIITGRREERLLLLKNKLEQLNVRVLTLCFDVCDEQSVNHSLWSLHEDWQSIDILVKNACLADGRST